MGNEIGARAEKRSLDHKHTAPSSSSFSASSSSAFSEKDKTDVKTSLPIHEPTWSERVWRDILANSDLRLDAQLCECINCNHPPYPYAVCLNTRENALLTSLVLLPHGTILVRNWRPSARSLSDPARPTTAHEFVSVALDAFRKLPLTSFQPAPKQHPLRFVGMTNDMSLVSARVPEAAMHRAGHEMRGFYQQRTTDEYLCVFLQMPSVAATMWFPEQMELEFKRRIQSDHGPLLDEVLTRKARDVLLALAVTTYPESVVTLIVSYLPLDAFFTNLCVHHPQIAP
jgi:hypothetical protein